MIGIASESTPWLARFHAGERSVLAECYREHVARVLSTASRLLTVADAETVTHEVFLRILSDAEVREGFRGGNLGAWLSQIVHNASIDLLRRRRHEAGAPEDDRDAEIDPARHDEEVEAKMLVERFKRMLPAKWLPVFEARFLRQLPQREAAAELGMQRSTLAYQEQRVRELLEAFLLRGEEPS
jgi:RNA polymerase sigma-70 factor (ECF subfamily)